MMKSLLAAAAAATIAAVAVPAFAQSGEAPAVTGYVNLGYSYVDANPVKFHVLGGRLGARFGKYVGVEGEGGFGVNSDTFSGVNFKLTSTYNGYGVAYLPMTPYADLFARVGYGHTNIRGSLAGVSVGGGENSLNFGGGVQYFFTKKDGFRGEYTRYDFRNGGGSANVYGISYVRKFP